MFANPLNRWLFRRLRPGRRPRRAPAAPCRPALEALEARAVPATINWIGGAYRDAVAVCSGVQTGSPTAWSNPLNWENGVVPGPNDIAFFPPNPIRYTYCGSQPVPAPYNRTPVVDVPVTIAGINAPVSGSNVGLVSLTVNQPLTLTGASEWDSGTINVAGTASFTNQGTLRLVNPSAVTLSGTLTNQGTIQQAGAGNLVLANGTLVNQMGALYDLQGDHGPVFNGGAPATFTNSGTLRKSAGTGTTDFTGVTMNNTGGTIDVRTGKLIAWDGNNGASTGGTFTVATGATLQITSAATTNSFTGAYTGSGGGKVLLNGGTFAARGTSLNFPPDLFEWDAGTINTTGGSLTNLNSLTLATSATKTLTGSLVNNGAIVQKDTGLFSFGSGSVTNQRNSLYDIQGDAGISGSGPFVNNGIVRKSGGIGTSTIAVNGFNNQLANAVIDVRTGTLIPWNGTNGVSNGGTFSVATGAVLQVANNGATNTFNGVYTGMGGGTVLLNSANFTVASGASLDFPGRMFQLAGGALTVATGSRLTNLGGSTLNWTGGSLVLNSRATLTNGGTLNLASANPMVLSGGGTVMNNGTINQTGAGSLNLGVTLMNNFGGRYVFQADSGITGTQAVSTFTNAGLVTKTAGRGVSAINGNVAFDNTAGLGVSIDVETGTISNASSFGTSSGGTFVVAAGATLDLTGGNTVTYTGSYSAVGGGTIALSGGTLKLGSGGASFNFPAPMFQWTGGLIDTNQNTLRNLGTLTLANAGAVVLYDSGSLINAGTIIQSGAGGLIINSISSTNLTTLTNQAGATYTLKANTGMSTTAGGGSFVNQGTLTKSAGTGTSTLGVYFTNSGATVDVEAGTLTLSFATYNGGIFVASQGATLDLTGTTAVTATGTLTGTGAGTVLLAVGNLTVGSAGLTLNFAPGLFQWTSGTLTIPTGTTLTNNGTVTATPPGAISFVSNGTLVNNGTITLSGNGVLTSSGTGPLTNNGSLTLSGIGQKGLTATVTNTASGTLTLAGAGLKFFSGAITNQGTMTQSDTGNLLLNGDTLTNQAGALYALQSDAGFLAAGGTFINQGTFQKSGGTATSAIDSFFRNPGTVLALSGTLGIDSNNTDVSGMTLASGTWEVFAHATLNLNHGVNLTTSNAVIVLDGANPNFVNVAHLATNGGSLTVQDSGSLTLAGTFTNSGTLAVDATSSLTLTGSLSNFANGTLTGGTFLIAGTLKFPNANIVTNAASLVLDGSGPGQVLDQNGNSGLANLAANAATGSLAVQNGETFATAGDFNNLGTLSIDGTSTFTVSGNLANFDPNSGTLNGGTFVVAGTFQFTGANVITDAATLVLDGTGPGQILDENGNNGLANLAAIAAGGKLTLQNGYMLTTAGDLANFGYLLIDATSQLAVSGNYTQDVAATLEIQLDGIGGTSGQLNIAGAANLNGTLTLTPVNGYVPSTGDSFAILTFGTRNGSDFANPPAGFSESFDDGNGILTVIAQ
jgi:hypothetical protein